MDLLPFPAVSKLINGSTTQDNHFLFWRFLFPKSAPLPELVIAL